MTKECHAMTAIIAIGYGGQDEILRAIRSLDISEKNLAKITLEDIMLALETGRYPPPDIIIRTG
jgi:undecaprenyl diphosphate synthase